MQFLLSNMQNCKRNMVRNIHYFPILLSFIQWLFLQVDFLLRYRENNFLQARTCSDCEQLTIQKEIHAQFYRFHSRYHCLQTSIPFRTLLNYVWSNCKINKMSIFAWCNLKTPNMWRKIQKWFPGRKKGVSSRQL